MSMSADRAPAGPGPPPTVCEDVAAAQAGVGLDNQLHSLAADGPVNMLQVAIDLFFHDAQGLGKFSGIEGLLLEQGDDLLSDGRHGLPTQDSGSEVAGKNNLNILHLMEMHRFPVITFSHKTPFLAERFFTYRDNSCVFLPFAPIIYITLAK